MADANVRQRVHHRIDDCRSRTDRSRFSHSLHPEWVDIGRRLGSGSLIPRQLVCFRHRIIHQRSGNELTCFIVDDLFKESLTESLSNSAVNLAVDEPYRARGVARRLLDDLFGATTDDAMRGYTLEVRVSNARAIHLYEAAGFRTTGVRRGYYTDNREDAYVMWKDPIPPAMDGAGPEESVARAGRKVLRG